MNEQFLANRENCRVVPDTTRDNYGQMVSMCRVLPPKGARRKNKTPIVIANGWALRKELLFNPARTFAAMGREVVLLDHEKSKRRGDNPLEHQASTLASVVESCGGAVDFQLFSKGAIIFLLAHEELLGRINSAVAVAPAGLCPPIGVGEMALRGTREVLQDASRLSRDMARIALGTIRYSLPQPRGALDEIIKISQSATGDLFRCALRVDEIPMAAVLLQSDSLYPPNNTKAYLEHECDDQVPVEVMEGTHVSFLTDHRVAMASLRLSQTITQARTDVA